MILVASYSLLHCLKSAALSLEDIGPTIVLNARPNSHIQELFYQKDVIISPQPKKNVNSKAMCAIQEKS
jgi:hypothetical protein